MKRLCCVIVIFALYITVREMQHQRVRLFIVRKGWHQRRRFVGFHGDIQIYYRNRLGMRGKLLPATRDRRNSRAYRLLSSTSNHIVAVPCSRVLRREQEVLNVCNDNHQTRSIQSRHYKHQYYLIICATLRSEERIPFTSSSRQERYT